MTRRQIRVVGAMLEREPGRYLITQRSKTASLPLLWEFPGGRVQEGESDEVALVQLFQNLGNRMDCGTHSTILGPIRVPGSGDHQGFDYGGGRTLNRH